MVDRSVRVRVSAIMSDFDRAMLSGSAKARAFARELDSADTRMNNLIQTGLALAPALVPLGAAAVPAVAGLATQLGFAAVAGGTAVLAFNGVGDALDALNKAQLEPTAENIEKARQAFDEIGPAAQEFVVFLDDIEPKLESLQRAAAAGFLPGAEEGITEMLDLLPQLRAIIREVADTSGDLFAEAGDNLNDPRFQEFFRFLETEARPALTNLGRTVGNVFEGVANLFIGLDPLSDDFGRGLLELSRDFSEATRNLDESSTFQDFIAYVQANGPRAAEALGAVAEAVLALVQAGAPVGEVALPAIEAIADVITAVANSPAGPVLIGTAAGLAAVSRAIALFKAAQGSALLGMLGGLDKQGRGAGIGARAAAAGIGVLGLSLTNLDEKAGLSNTAMFAMIGFLAGPWGAAIGAAAGLTKDFVSANDDLEDSLRRANEAATDPLGLSTQRQAIAGVKAEVTELEARYEGAVGTFGRAINPLNDVSAKFKLVFGGAIGELDRAEDHAQQLEEQLRLDEIAVADFFHQLSTGQPARATTDIIDDLRNIDQIAAELGPILDELGIDPRVITDPTREGWDEAMAAIRRYRNEQDSLPGRTRVVADAFGALDSALASTEDKASALADALDQLLGPALDADEALVAWKRALATLNDELERGRATLNVNTKAGQDHRDSIRGRVEALSTLITAQARAMSAEELAAGGAQRLALRLREGRRAILDQAEAAGFSRRRVAAYLNTLNLTPKLIETVFETIGLDRAEIEAIQLAGRYNALPKDVRTELKALGGDASRADVRRLAREYDLTPRQVQTILKVLDQASGPIDSVRIKLEDLDGKTATTFLTHNITTVHRTLGTTLRGLQEQADGGILRYADGGNLPPIGGQPPQIQPNHGPRGIMWAEEGAGPWEAFISGHPAKRARSTDIWRQVGRRLGVEFEELADGALLAFQDGGGLSDLQQTRRRVRRFESALEELREQRERVRLLRQEVATRTEILLQQQSIRDLERDLNRRVRDKNGRLTKTHELRGLDRRVALAQLRDARRELGVMRRSDNLRDRALRKEERLERLLRRRFGTHREELRTLRQLEAEIERQREQAQARRDETATLAGAGDLFGGPFASTRSAQRQVDEAIADIHTYGTIITRLKRAGASPFILRQIAEQARQGNFDAANKLGQALLDDPEALRELNRSTGLLQDLSSQVAGVTTDPRFFRDNRFAPRFNRPGSAAARAGTYITVEHLEVKAFSDRFSIKQVMDELAMHGVT